MTLTADELIFNKICAIYDIETILGRFGPLRKLPMTKSAKYHFNVTSCTELLRSFVTTQMIDPKLAVSTPLPWYQSTLPANADQFRVIKVPIVNYTMT